MADECPHSPALTPDTCSLCKQADQPDRSRHLTNTFPARYDGQCPGCNLPISVGQIIVMAWTGEDGDRKAYHKGCA